MIKKLSLFCTLLIVLPVVLLLPGCQTKEPTVTSTPPAPSQPAAPSAAAPATPSVTAAPLNSGPPALVLANGAYRVKAGAQAPFIDSQGRVWQADAGFSGGDVIERDADTKIQN